MTVAVRRLRVVLQSLPFKTLVALGSAVLPALVVAAILGTTLMTAVRDAEADFNNAMSVSRDLTDIRVLLEKERGLVARLPGELDLARVDVYTGSRRGRSAAGCGNQFACGQPPDRFCRGRQGNSHGAGRIQPN
jgi:hypothetical protein